MIKHTLSNGVTVSARPLMTERGLGFVHPTYRDAMLLAAQHHASIISSASLRRMALDPTVKKLDPVILPDADMRADNPRRVGETIKQYETRIRAPMNSTEWRALHDTRVLAQMTDDFAAYLNAGKHPITGAPRYRYHLMGWYNPITRQWIQEASRDLGPHDDMHSDYSMTLMLEWSGRPIIRAGAYSEHVIAFKLEALQSSGDLTPYFDKTCERLAKEWQSANGLVPDGVIGAVSWAALGYTRPLGGVVCNAVLAALRDADKRWPKRKRASDGTLGDASHAARKSDHNPQYGKDGQVSVPVLAVDITHDPASGADGAVIAAAACEDPRTAYVIWNGGIYNQSIADKWRPYNGDNKHTHHVHISIKTEEIHSLDTWQF